MRLDSYVAQYWPETSRSQWQRNIAAGHVLVNGEIERSAKRVLNEDDEVAITKPDQVSFENQTIPVIYQDDNVIVLNGDAADEQLLIEENIDSADVFASLTNSEEANIMSALLAKRMGVRKVIALINRSSYVNLLQEGRIDIAIAPAQATIGRSEEHTSELQSH